MRQNKLQFLALIVPCKIVSFFHGGPLSIRVDEAAYPLVANKMFDHTDRGIPIYRGQQCYRGQQ